MTEPKLCQDCTHYNQSISKEPCKTCHVDVTGVPAWTPKEGVAEVVAEEPRDPRLDWPLDLLLVVSSRQKFKSGEGRLRYFSGVQDGNTTCFIDGQSSLTTNCTMEWGFARPATKADIDRLRPKLESWMAKPKGEV